MKTEEIWRDIENYEGLYQVSDLGRVRSLKFGKIKVLKPVKTKKGYLRVHLSKNSERKHFSVHRLVATAFIQNPENLPQVNHKNEDKSDNRVENLEWCSSEYNINYGTRSERMAKARINHPDMSKPVLQFSKDGEFIKEYPSASEVERQTEYPQGYISSCCRYDRKSAYGFIWRYKNP